MQNGEEAFSENSTKRARGSDESKSNRSELLSTAFYVVLGIGLALVVREALALGLHTDMPVVAVVSASMQHDNPQQTYYQWLQTYMGYNRSYIDSWPVPNGMLVGDMPIVEGASGYDVGDVIVYSVPGSDVPIIHRIIKVSPDGTYQTKGDNNLQQLPYELSVRTVQVHGKVVAVIPKLGYFKVFTMRVFGM